MSKTVTLYIVTADDSPVVYSPYFATEAEARDWISAKGEDDGWEGMRMDVEEVEFDEEEDE